MVAETLAGEGAAFVRRRRAEVFGADAGTDGDAAVQTKTTPTDPVTVVDTETERLLRDRPRPLFPSNSERRAGQTRHRLPKPSLF